jgi:hypothetical protein
MDPQQRISELEAQVRTLSSQVTDLRQEEPAESNGAETFVPARWTSRITLLAGAALLTLVVMTILDTPMAADMDFSPGSIARLLGANYIFTTCAALLGLGVLFVGLQRKLTGALWALLAAYTAYGYLAFVIPDAVALAPTTFFWISSGILTGFFALISLACIVDAQRTDRGKRGVAAFAGLNALLYFAFTWKAVAATFPEDVWVQRAAVAAVFALFTALSESAGVRRNPVFHVFLASTLLVASFMLEALLPPLQLTLAFALEGFVLAVLYKRAGIVVFKVIGLLTLIPIFTGSIMLVKAPGTIELAERSIPANWFYGLANAGVLILTACLYENFVRRLSPQHRTRCGHWFLADTWLDVPSATASMLHAATAALVLLFLTIMDQGHATGLPYMLGLLSLLVATVGILLNTPQVRVGGVLLLAGAHVSYYFFLGLDRPDFESQNRYILYTSLLGAYSFFAAYLWERYLSRILGRRHREHITVAAIPYLAAAVLVTTLLARQFDGVYAPLAQNALGIGLLLLGYAIRGTSLKSAGFLALGIGSATFFVRLFNAEAALVKEPNFGLYLMAMLVTYVVAERLLYVVKRQAAAGTFLLDACRLVVVLTGVTLLGASVYEWTA